MRRITFDQECVPFILNCFGWRVGTELGCEGYLLDEHGHNVKALDGQFIKIEDFAGIVKTDEGKRAIRRGFWGAFELLMHETSR